MSSHERGRSSERLLYLSDTFVVPSTKEPEAVRLLERCSNYTIGEFGVPLEHPAQDYVEHFYKTVSGGDWRLKIHGLPQKKYQYVNGNMQQMQIIENHLAKIQALDFPNDKESAEGRHAMGMHFVASNLPIIDSLLTNNNSPKNGSRQPVWFIETEVPHPSKKNNIRTDIIFIGSDNRFRILEFGNQTGKPDKVMKYVSGLQLLYEQKTGTHLPPNRIIPYVVRYQRAEDAYELDFYPPDILGELYHQQWLERKQKTA